MTSAITYNYNGIDTFNNLPNDSFSILHINSRRLYKIYYEIVEYLSLLNTNFSVLDLGKTWFGNQLNSLIQMDGYTLTD